MAACSTSQKSAVSMGNDLELAPNLVACFAMTVVFVGQQVAALVTNRIRLPTGEWFVFAQLLVGLVPAASGEYRNTNASQILQANQGIDSGRPRSNVANSCRRRRASSALSHSLIRDVMTSCSYWSNLEQIGSRQCLTSV